MFPNSSLIQEDFDSFLLRFSSNRDEAGAIYEEIRTGLVRYFYLKGCYDPETLADESINRATIKLKTLETDQKFKPKYYVYSIASKVFLEYLKNEKKTQGFIKQNTPHSKKNNFVEEDKTEEKHLCLEKCLTELAAEDKKIVIEYFSKERREKIEHRRNLAKQLGLKVELLQVRVFRIKKILRKCVEKCYHEKNIDSI